MPLFLSLNEFNNKCTASKEKIKNFLKMFEENFELYEKHLFKILLIFKVLSDRCFEILNIFRFRLQKKKCNSFESILFIWLFVIIFCLLIFCELLNTSACLIIISNFVVNSIAVCFSFFYLYFHIHT